MIVEYYQILHRGNSNSYIAQITISLTKFVETGKNNIRVASEKKK